MSVQVRSVGPNSLPATATNPPAQKIRPSLKPSSALFSLTITLQMIDIIAPLSHAGQYTGVLEFSLHAVPFWAGGQMGPGPVNQVALLSEQARFNPIIFVSGTRKALDVVGRVAERV